jgi:hypothetical protein
MKIQANLARGGTPTEIIVTGKVTEDGESLARAIVVESEGVRALRPLDPSGVSFVQRVDRAREHCVTVTAGIVDEHGNSVWPNAVRETFCPKSEPVAASGAPAAATAKSGEPVPDSAPAEASRPIPAPVWIGVGLTGALAVATTVLGIVALDARDEYHQKNDDPAASVPERRELESAAKAAENRATIAGIATGVVGSATLVLYLTRPTSETQLRAAVGPRQVRVALDF